MIIKTVCVYIDARYMNNASFSWGKKHGMARGKFNYSFFVKDIADRYGDIQKSVVYFTGSNDRNIPFKKFLAKNKFQTMNIDSHNNVSRMITADLATMSTDTRLPDVVIMATGNGRLISLARAIKSSSSEIVFCSYEDSTAQTILKSDFSRLDASEYTYDSLGAEKGQ